MPDGQGRCGALAVQFCAGEAGPQRFFLPLNVAAEYPDKAARRRNLEDGMGK